MSCHGCGPKCTCDHSTNCPQKPSLLDLDDVREILIQAMVNMAMRIAALHQGKMEPEEVQQASERLVKWLIATFSGRNPNYQSSEDWNPEGLAGALRVRLADMLAAVPDDDEEMLEVAFGFLAGQMQDAILNADAPDPGAEHHMPANCRELIEYWCLVLTGAPDEFFS